MQWSCDCLRDIIWTEWQIPHSVNLKRARESSQTSAVAAVRPGTLILQVANTMPPHITAKLKIHHKTVTLWGHFLVRSPSSHVFNGDLVSKDALTTRRPTDQTATKTLNVRWGRELSGSAQSLSLVWWDKTMIRVKKSACYFSYIPIEIGDIECSSKPQIIW